MTHVRFCNSCCLLFLFLANASSTTADDWPALRGKNAGHGQLSSRLTAAESLRLQTRWKRALGSGFSSVVISRGRVFAMYSDGAEDQLACLEGRTGDDVWRVSLGPTFEGKNGSFDGPLATPAVHQGLIFALNGRGVLAAYRVEDGSTVWSIDLVEAHGAVTPLYGFATSPIVSKDTLVIQHGARDFSVMGIDPLSGDVKWKAAKGVVNSQSPAILNLESVELVACCCGKQVFGIDAATGDVQFEFTHEGGNGSAVVPVQIAADTMLVTDDDSFSEAYQLEANNGQLEAHQKWKQRSIKNTYNVPCTSTAGVIAFSTRILTCVDPESGRAKWKSREPGDGFLVTAGKWLVIGTKEGGLHLAEIDEQRYQEVSHVSLFSDVMWSVPAIADDAVFVRSLGEIACVDLVPADGNVVASTETDMPLSEEFQRFLANIDRAADDDSRNEIIEAYLHDAGTTPIVDQGIAHFVYRGPGMDVALACDSFGARQEQPMVHVAGTDLYYYGLKLPAGQRMNYMFLVDFKPTLDPLNPRKMTSTVYAGEMEFAVRLRNDAPLSMSWFGMSEFEEPKYLNSSSDASEVTLFEEELAIESQGEPYPATIYLPPGYSTKVDRSYPVVFVFDALNAKRRGDMPQAIDRMFRLEMAPPAIVVFLDGGTGRQPDAFANVLADEILPALKQSYRIDEKRESKICWGTNFTAGVALATLVSRPDVFGAAAIQSPLVFDDARNQAADALRTVDQPVKLYLEWGRYDMFNPVENWDVRAMSQEFVEAVSSNPNVSLLGGQVDDSTDWSSWRNRYDVLLKALIR